MGLCVWWTILRSPGDDNPIAMLGVVAMFVGMFPASGLILVVRNPPPSEYRAWLYFAVPTGFLSALLFAMLVSLW